MGLRLTSQSAGGPGTKPESDGFPFGQAFDRTLADRLREADEFYVSVIPSSLDEDAARVMRQALGGDALEQAVLPLRPRQVARGTGLGSIPSRAQGASQLGQNATITETDSAWGRSLGARRPA